jgi:nucleoside-diphosphate-sugar epimerase
MLDTAGDQEVTRMRILVAGATGAIGARLVPLLVDGGHTVAGLTRSSDKRRPLEAAGAEAIVCDVYDAAGLKTAVVDFRPDAMIDELTDLPDRAADLESFAGRNDRMRREGTRNLLDAARAAAIEKLLAQSIAWHLPGDRGAAVDELERAVLDAGGVVVRYGRLYGPGTFYETDLPEPPRVHVDEAARRTVALLDAPPGIVEVVD